VLQRYSVSPSALPLDEILADGRDPVEALAELLHTAARVYTANPGIAGCLVLEASRMSGDTECRTMAQNYRAQSHARIHAFITASHPDAADSVTDFVDTVLSGLSTGAREGWSRERLADVARVAAAGIAASLH
jgi:TetR/AcrR family transcriptional repressor for divergent bdcA